MTLKVQCWEPLVFKDLKSTWMINFAEIKVGCIITRNKSFPTLIWLSLSETAEIVARDNFMVILPGYWRAASFVCGDFESID